MIKNQRKKKSNLLMLPGHCFLQNELFLTLNSYEKKKKRILAPVKHPLVRQSSQ